MRARTLVTTSADDLLDFKVLLKLEYQEVEGSLHGQQHLALQDRKFSVYENLPASCRTLMLHSFIRISDQPFIVSLRSLSLPIPCSPHGGD